ncbi:MAG: hypothetical protein D6820_03640 [Lentisphaerae bacterium]|nr:MAG: hypothetical protein D6820_03640 [Lentisphaerota bacterium]
MTRKGKEMSMDELLNDVICPECKQPCSEEFIRCPNCQSYIHELSPWEEERILPALLVGVLGWVALTLLIDVMGYHTNILARIFEDHISRFIFAACLYGLVIVVQKYRIFRRQVLAFELIRNQVLRAGEPCHTKTDYTALLKKARELLSGRIRHPVNTLLAYNRLRWLPVISRTAKGPEHAHVTRAFERQLDDDVAAVENGFSTIRFLIWLLPSLGFFGTVWGMTIALREFSDTVNVNRSDLSFFGSLSETVRGLGTAFHTTLVGLGLVIPLLLYTSILRRKVYNFFNRINRFFLNLAFDVVNVPWELSSEGNEAEKECAPVETEGGKAEEKEHSEGMGAMEAETASEQTEGGADIEDLPKAGDGDVSAGEDLAKAENEDASAGLIDDVSDVRPVENETVEIQEKEGDGEEGSPTHQEGEEMGANVPDSMDEVAEPQDEKTSAVLSDGDNTKDNALYKQE